jgi:hypothetical protein
MGIWPIWNHHDEMQKWNIGSWVGWNWMIDVVWPILIIQVKQFKSMIWPRIWHLMASHRPKTWVMWVWNPIACSYSSTWCGSTQQEYLESQIMSRPWSWKTYELGKFMIVGKTTCGWCTLLTIIKGGWSSCHTACGMHLESKMAPIVRPLHCGTKWYVHCNKSSDVKLVHDQRNQCAWDPFDVVSIKIGLPNQTWTCCHPTKTCGHESPNGGTFSKR